MIATTVLLVLDLRTSSHLIQQISSPKYASELQNNSFFSRRHIHSPIRSLPWVSAFLLTVYLSKNLSTTTCRAHCLTLDSFELHTLSLSAADERPAHLVHFSIALLSISLFFWFWALINTIRLGFDLGVVCFLTSALTSSYLLALGNAKRVPESNITKLLVTGSHVFVAVVYALGAYAFFAYLKSVTRGVYCVVFFFLWLGFAYCGHQLMNKKEERSSKRGETARLLERLESQGHMSVV